MSTVTEKVMGGMAFALCCLLATLVAPSAWGQGLDIDAAMPCAPPAHVGTQSPDVCSRSRDLFMQNCTSCHTVIPVIRMQKPDNEWDATIVRHREKITEAADEDLELVGQFLKDRFRPGRPVPKIPQELIDSDPGFPAA